MKGTSVDIVIRNGLVMDGTGGAEIEADVGIKDGTIVAIGAVAAKGEEEIDAKGQIVTPGFVDLHTHYDGQAVWDPYLAPSSIHGTTTVLMGNCGVGFAPCKPEDRERLIDLMEGVEDIPAPALHEGLDWNWHSFADYLDRISGMAHDIDIAAMVPHAPLRVYAMGERANHREMATADEIAQMAALAHDAIKAGAFGFSTSRTMAHKTLGGEFIPTLRAQERELFAIATAVEAAGGGLLEIVSDWDPDPVTEFSMLRRIAAETKQPIVFTLSERQGAPENYKLLVELADTAIDEGLSIRPVFAPRATGVLLGLRGSQNPFSGCPTYKTLAHLPAAERAAAMRAPEVRRQILSEDPVKESTFALIHRLGYKWMFHFDDNVDYEPAEENSVEAIASRQGRPPAEVAYDALTDGEGADFLYVPIGNYANYDLSFSETMLKNRNAIVGLGDGGAHVGSICDASFSTFLLTHWARDRASGRIPVTEAVRRLTSDTAQAMGLADRGVIALGKKADINVIDFDRLKLRKPHVVHDLRLCASSSAKADWLLGLGSFS